MPFADSDDDVFPGEKSFAMCMRLSTVTGPYRAQESPLHMARRACKELFARMREYLTAAKKEYLATDTAEGFVQRMRAAFPRFDADVLLDHPLRYQPELPASPGAKGVGIVEAVGPGVQHPTVGTRVVFVHTWNTWREQVVCPVDRLVPVPEGLDDPAAATSYTNPLTAWALTR